MSAVQPWTDSPTRNLMIRNVLNNYVAFMDAAADPFDVGDGIGPGRYAWAMPPQANIEARRRQETAWAVRTLCDLLPLPIDWKHQYRTCKALRDALTADYAHLATDEDGYRRPHPDDWKRTRAVVRRTFRDCSANVVLSQLTNAAAD